MMRLPRALRPLVVLAGSLFGLWMRTWRVRVHESDGRIVPMREHRFDAEIYAFSERDLIAAACVGIYTDFHVLVADGNDGDWAIALTEPLGGHFIRGSSLRNGLAGLRELIRELRESRLPMGMVADGPLGPVGVAKEGVVACAAHTSRPIVPATARAWPKVTFTKSWAKHYLPLPFARVEFFLRAPVVVPADVSRAGMSAIARGLLA